MTTYLTREAAAKLGLCKTTLQRYINCGSISAPELKPMKGNPRFQRKSGRFREWTDLDIETARLELAAIRPKEAPKDLFSTTRAAQILRMPRSTLYVWMASGKVAGPSVTLRNAALPGSDRIWSSIRLWTREDIERVAILPYARANADSKRSHRRSRRTSHGMSNPALLPALLAAPSLKRSDNRKG